MTHAALASTLVVAVVALAYGTQAPRLAVAEFAPSAQRSIEAPPTTSAASGPRGGAGGRPAITTTTSPATTSSVAEAASLAPTTRVARSRACVGEPPLQTEDPMSPPCHAAIFEGDNGGATATGVSGTEIRIAIPINAGGATASWAAPQRDAVAALFDFFNTRFELYGRRLVPVFVDGETSSATLARAQAAEVAARSVFGALTAFHEWNGAPSALVQNLARDGIVSVVRNTDSRWSDALVFDEYDPFVWSVYPSSEDLGANLAAFACSSLSGHPAAHAGDQPLTSATRRFGVVAFGDFQPPPVRDLVDALAQCSGQAVPEVAFTKSTGATEQRAGLARLQADGATTLICFCEGLSGFSGAVTAAHQAGFHPEWIAIPSTSTGANDDEGLVQSRRGSLAPPLRLGAGPKLLPLQARPWFGALLSAGIDASSTTTDFRAVWGIVGLVYEQLLVFAAGIQGAGPNLSPQTFGSALMGLQFPNPGAGTSPYWQPGVGFGPGDHSFFDDYTVSWWSDDAEALNYPVSTSPRGSWCYLDRGARYRVGSYPADADQRLFAPDVACR